MFLENSELRHNVIVDRPVKLWKMMSNICSGEFHQTYMKYFEELRVQCNSYRWKHRPGVKVQNISLKIEIVQMRGPEYELDSLSQQQAVVKNG
jgi:hypothetical protein